MRALVLGASGSIAGKLLQRLFQDGKIGDSLLEELILADLQEPKVQAAAAVVGDANANKPIMTTARVDLTDPTTIPPLLTNRPEYIFHLAAIVSGDAEAHFELGYQVNVDGMRNVLEAIRKIGDGYKPRLVFSSSLAVYGPPLPPVVCDHQAATPRGSYGTQKLMAELLVEDYSRKGYVDGISIRFPTIAVRPGVANQAASSFISGIIREPLNGQTAQLPVHMEFKHPIASPRKAVEYLIQAATLTPQQSGDRTLNVPSIAVTVHEMLEALERVASKDVVALVQHRPDPFILDIVDKWPQEFQCERATELGFQPDASYDDILRAYIQDELGGSIPAK